MIPERALQTRGAVTVLICARFARSLNGRPGIVMGPARKAGRNCGESGFASQGVVREPTLDLRLVRFASIRTRHIVHNFNCRGLLLCRCARRSGIKMPSRFL